MFNRAGLHSRAAAHFQKIPLETFCNLVFTLFLSLIPCYHLSVFTLLLSLIYNDHLSIVIFFYHFFIVVYCLCLYGTLSQKVLQKVLFQYNVVENTLCVSALRSLPVASGAIMVGNRECRAECAQHICLRVLE